MTDPRPSIGATAFPDGPWKSAIRIIAAVLSVMGIALMGGEIFSSVTCPDDLKTLPCSHIDLGTMLWGFALTVFGLLVLQYGNVSSSLNQFVAQGSIIRGWFTRSGRSTDPEGTKVMTVVTPPPEEKKP